MGFTTSLPPVCHGCLAEEAFWKLLQTFLIMAFVLW